MARQWVVLFDTLGVDTLLPWDELKGDDMLDILSGKKPKNRLNGRISMMIMRAQANMQRWPEVWAYDTADDIDEPDMREMWQTTPQVLADLVRQKGTNLFRHQRQKEIIV
jgi:hypothetical protein